MRRSGPPYRRFADSASSVGPPVPMNPETRRLVRLAAEGLANPDEVRALVALGGWRDAARRLDAERPALVGEAVDFAWCHAVGLDLRLGSFLRLVGRKDDPWTNEHVASLRELRTQVAAWRKELGR